MRYAAAVAFSQDNDEMDDDIDWAEAGRRAFLKQPTEPLPMRRRSHYIAYIFAFVALGALVSLAQCFGG